MEKMGFGGLSGFEPERFESSKETFEEIISNINIDVEDGFLYDIVGNAININHIEMIRVNIFTNYRNDNKTTVSGELYLVSGATKELFKFDYRGGQIKNRSQVKKDVTRYVTSSVYKNDKTKTKRNLTWKS